MKNSLGMEVVSEVLHFSDTISFDFQGNNGITIEEVIVHLQGLQKIAKNIPGLLEKIYNAHNIKSVRCQLIGVNIHRVEIGSLEDWLNLAVEVAIVGEADEKTKQRVIDDIKKMSATAKIGLLIAGIGIGMIVRGCGDAGTTMNNSSSLQQTLAVNIGTTFKLSPDKVAPILDKATDSPSAAMIQGALDFVSPAKVHGGNIVCSKDSDLSTNIPDSFLSTLPRNYEKPIQKPHVETVSHVELIIRALDMDNPEKGWGAVIPAIMPEKRFNIELAENIDRTKLMRSRITGDVEVTYQIKGDSKKPVRVFLAKVYDENKDE